MIAKLVYAYLLLLFSEINKINMNSFDFRFDRTRSKLCTKPNYGNGALSGIRFCLHTDEAWGEIDLHPVELFTFSGHDTDFMFGYRRHMM